MSLIDYDANNESPELQSILLEPILLHCIEGCSMSDLIKVIQDNFLIPISCSTLKQYLYHLINYDLVSYNGKKNFFETKNEGMNLLFMINKEKKTIGIKSEDLIIILEE